MKGGKDSGKSSKGSGKHKGQGKSSKGSKGFGKKGKLNEVQEGEEWFPKNNGWHDESWDENWYDAGNVSQVWDYGQEESWGQEWSSSSWEQQGHQAHEDSQQVQSLVLSPLISDLFPRNPEFLTGLFLETDVIGEVETRNVSETDTTCQSSDVTSCDSLFLVWDFNILESA